MEMVLLVTICIFTGTFIAKQHDAMRQMRVRVKENERRDR